MRVGLGLRSAVQLGAGGGGPGLLTSLLAYYRLSDSVADASGNSRTLSSGSLTYGTGKLGRGAATGGATGAALGGAARAVDTTSLSIAGWINFDAGWSGAFSSVSGSRFGLNHFYVMPQKDPEFDTSGFYVQVGGSAGEYGPAIAAFSGWKHVAVVWNAPTLTVYVNGAVHTTQTLAGVGTGDVAGFTPLVTPTGDIDMPMDEVAVYEVALTPVQVAALYNAGAAHDPTRVTPVNTVLPTITGSPTDGETLTASTGSWTGPVTSPTFTYQWNRAGVAIGSATAATYGLTPDDVGEEITVTVTATDGPLSASATSAEVGPVAPAPLPSPPVGNPAGQMPTVFVQDVDTGNVLYIRSEDTQSEAPGSVVKLATAILARRAHPSDWTTRTITLTAGDCAQPIPGLTLDLIGFQDLDVVTYEDLAHAILLPSDCAGCVAFARVIGTEIFTAAGSGTTGVERFVEEMNLLAAELGIEGVFFDPYGGSKTFGPDVVRNTLSAKDAAKLCVEAMSDPVLRAIVVKTTHVVTVTGGRSTTIVARNYNAFRNGPWVAGALTLREGLTDASVLGGKNGAWDLGSLHSHSLAQFWTAPNGNEIVISVIGSETPWALINDVKGIIYSLCRDFSYLTTGVSAATDPYYANVKILAGGDVFPFVEEKSGVAITNTSVAAGDPVNASEGGMAVSAVTDLLSFAHAAGHNVGSGDMTVDVWYTGPGTAPGVEYVWAGKWAGGAVEWTWDYNGGALQLFASADGTAATNGVALALGDRFTSLNVFFNGAPRLLSFVKQGATWALYVNGERMPGTISVATAFATSTPITLGLSGASALGRYDDFRVTVGTARYTLGMHEVSSLKFPRSGPA